MSKIFKPPRGAVLNTTHPLARGLVGCWLMNEGTGRRIFDYSGNKNHGLMTNMDPATDWKAGPHGWAVDFDGGDDYVYFGTNKILFPDVWTIVANVKCTTTTSNKLCTWTTATHPSIWINLALNQLLLYMGADNYAYFDSEAFSVVTNGLWHQIAFSIPGIAINDINNAKCYVDATLYAIDSVKATGAQSAKTIFSLGYTNVRYRDILSFLCLYNRVLSPAEIAWLYESPYSMFGLDIRSSYFPEPSPPVIIRPQKPKVYVFGGLYIKNTGTGSSLKVAVA